MYACVCARVCKLDDPELVSVLHCECNGHDKVLKPLSPPASEVIPRELICNWATESGNGSATLACNPCIYPAHKRAYMLAPKNSSGILKWHESSW